MRFVAEKKVFHFIAQFLAEIDNIVYISKIIFKKPSRKTLNFVCSHINVMFILNNVPFTQFKVNLDINMFLFFLIAYFLDYVMLN